MGSLISSDDSKLKKSERIMKSSYSIELISPNEYKTSVLPILTENPKLKHQLIYQDSRLPPSLRLPFKDLETKIEREVNMLTFISIWFCSKISVNIIRDRNLFAGAGLFDKYVLATAIPCMIFGFPYLSNLVRDIKFVDVEPLIFTDKRHPVLSQYRKRLVETFPNKTHQAYTINKELMAYDKVTIFDEKPVIPESQNEDGTEEEMELTASQLEYLEQQRIQKESRNPTEKEDS